MVQTPAFNEANVDLDAPTVVQSPSETQEAINAVRGQQTVVNHALHSANPPPMGHARPPLAPPHQLDPMPESDRHPPALMYLVLAMAGMIGLLLALLIWALVFR